MASPNCTLIVRPNVNLTDAAGNTWYFQDGQVYKNGTVDALTSHVIAIGFVDGKIVQENINKLWWTKTGQGYDGWDTLGAHHGRIANPFPASVSGETILPSSTAPIVDQLGNLWWIEDGKVVENGVVDSSTNGVIAMAYVNGKVYQENDQFVWWQKTNQGNDGWGTPETADGHIRLDQTGPSWTWVGGGDNDAGNPLDWSPGRLPQPGSTINMTSGTMNVSGNSLDGATINLNGPGSQKMTLNLSGEEHLRLTNGTPGWGDTTVNLADHSNWVGGFYAGVYGGGMLIQGEGQFANTSSIVGNGRATIDADVTGTGTFEVTSYRGSGRLEFMRAVSSGQSVTVETNTSYAGGRTYSTLQVDQPDSFDASVTLGYGEVILNALKADSYTFKNDLLSLYDGAHVVHTVPLTLTSGESGATGFGVTQIGSGVVIHADGTSTPHLWDGGTLLSQLT